MGELEKFLLLVWKNANKEIGHSWERLNHAMSEALTLAVGSGFVVEVEDLRAVYEKFRGGYWLRGGLEGVYRTAVIVGNLRAARAIEEYLGRPPFIVDGVELPRCFESEKYVHRVAYRKRERVVVGAEFDWKGHRVAVTSIKKDYFVACSYDGGKVEKRFRIGVSEIRSDRAERKR